MYASVPHVPLAHGGQKALGPWSGNHGQEHHVGAGNGIWVSFQSGKYSSEPSPDLLPAFPVQLGILASGDKMLPLGQARFQTCIKLL